MANLLEHKNIKFLFDRLTYSYHKTASDSYGYDGGPAAIKLIGGLVMAGALAGGTIGNALAPTEPVVYEHDTTEITQEYQEFLDAGIAELTEISEEIADLNRQALIQGYSDEDAAKSLLEQAAEKQKVLDEKIEYIAQSIYISPDMSETAFADYATAMFINDFTTDVLDFEQNVDADGLKECQAKYDLSDRTSASSIESCMTKSSKTATEMKAEATALSATIGAVLSLFPILLMAAAGGPAYSSYRANNKPRYGDYRKKKAPKVGDN